MLRQTGNPALWTDPEHDAWIYNIEYALNIW
jgi:hypothetical protein